MKIFNINILCRICLTQSENLISMQKTVDVAQNSPTVLEYLEQIISDKVFLFLILIVNKLWRPLKICLEYSYVDRETCHSHFINQ